MRKPHNYSHTPEAFWRRVDRSGDACWPWTGAKLSKGYGQVSYQGKMWHANRLAWTLANGPIPEGLWVLHRCDNPPCCNPEHLFLGTRTDNMRDMAAKGRGVYIGQARKTHCKRGHELAGDNVKLKNGGRERFCRACEAERYAKRVAAGAYKKANRLRAKASGQHPRDSGPQSTHHKGET